MINKFNGKKMSEQEVLDLYRFTWNSKCTDEQIAHMQELRNIGKDLCEFMISLVPNCADRSSAIRYLRLAIMQCNIAIAHSNLEINKIE